MLAILGCEPLHASRSGHSHASSRPMYNSAAFFPARGNLLWGDRQSAKGI